MVEVETSLVPGEDEIVLVPKAVGLNFRDVLNVMNLYPGDPGPLGSDCSGEIIAIGTSVQDLQVGDEVLGVAKGSLASQVITHSALVIKKPKFLSFKDAAAIPTVFMTAYYCLIIQAKLQEGETVLIHAGTGGVGLAAIQIANYCKAKIIATAGSEEKRKYLKSLGVKHVLDSRSLSYSDAIGSITNNKGVDVVFNSLTGPGFVETSLASTAKNGRFIEIGKRDIWTVAQVKAARPDIEYFIVALDTLMRDQPLQIQHLLQQVMLLFADKQLSPIPETVYPLAQAIAAFKYLQQAQQIGKVIIEIPSAGLLFKKNASYLITGRIRWIRARSC